MHALHIDTSHCALFYHSLVLLLSLLPSLLFDPSTDSHTHIKCRAGGLKFVFFREFSVKWRFVCTWGCLQCKWKELEMQKKTWIIQGTWKESVQTKRIGIKQTTKEEIKDIYKTGEQNNRKRKGSAGEFRSVLCCVECGVYMYPHLYDCTPSSIVSTSIFFLIPSANPPSLPPRPHTHTSNSSHSIRFRVYGYAFIGNIHPRT